MTTQNTALDGATVIDAFGRSYAWSDRYIESVFLANDGSTTNDTLNLTLTGDAWRIRRLGFDSASETAKLTVTLTDINDGIERRIDWLQLQDFGNTTMTLFTSRVRFLDGGLGGTVNLTFGAGSAN